MSAMIQRVGAVPRRFPGVGVRWLIVSSGIGWIIASVILADRSGRDV